MTEKKETEKSKEKKNEAPPLKGALADVLSRGDMSPAAEPKPKPAPAKEEGRKPYEVPEETLKAIFKEDI
jgi:hypothetical protein